MASNMESVTHWAQQMTCMYETASDKMKMLSDELPGSWESGIPAFKRNYPVLFDALECVFGSEPSGRLRDGLQAYVTLIYTDMQEAFCLNNYYHMSINTKHLQSQKRSAEVQQSSHDEKKPKQQMLGQQLFDSGKKYAADRIDALPDEFLDTLVVRNLQMKGFCQKEKDIENERAELAQQKLARRVHQSGNLQSYVAAAKGTDIMNDTTWVEPAVHQMIDDLEQLSEKGFWNNLGVKNGFHQALKNVLPAIWKPDMKTKSKTSLLPMIRVHLDTVNKVANKKAPNTISDADMTYLSRHKVLELFIQVDATMVCHEVVDREIDENMWQRNS
eukprot:scaffold168210_cov31-Attheya_sp.AAC.1